MHQPPIRVKPLEITWSEPSQTADGSGVAVNRTSEVTTRCQNPKHSAGLWEEYDCYMSLRCRAHSLIARRWREALKIPCIQEMVAAGVQRAAPGRVTYLNTYLKRWPLVNRSVQWLTLHSAYRHRVQSTGAEQANIHIYPHKETERTVTLSL